MSITQVDYEDRAPGDLIMVAFPMGWTVPAGWTDITQPNDPCVTAWRWEMPGDPPVHQAWGGKAAIGVAVLRGAHLPADEEQPTSVAPSGLEDGLLPWFPC